MSVSVDLTPDVLPPFCLYLQAPYLAYVEVLECDNSNTAPLPSKLLDTAASISYARSEDDLASCQLEEHLTRANIEFNGAVETVTNDDETGGWSQEDDDIVQVSIVSCIDRYYALTVLIKAVVKCYIYFQL